MGPIATEKEESKKSLVFDLLPDDCMENTTRLVNAEPNAVSWPRGFCTGDIVIVYNISGEYGRVTASRFDAIYVGDRNPLVDKEDNEILVRSSILAFKLLMPVLQGSGFTPTSALYPY